MTSRRMDSISTSTNTVSTLKKLARQVVKGMMPHMLDLVDIRSSETLESFIQGYNVQLEPEQALKLLQDTVLTMVADAEAVLREMDVFGPAYVRSTIDDIPSSATPFMLSVWNGDLYDVVEDDALNELISELSDRKTHSTEDDIFELAETSL